MSATVLAAIFLAALLHALWNAILKFETDKTAGALAVSVGSVPMAIGCLVYAGSPPSEAWLLVLTSGLLHTGYYIFLMNAYRLGDLSQVYPVARGVAPLITAVLASILLGEHLGPMEMIAVTVIALGLASLVLAARGDGRIDPVSCGLAVVTGIFIAGYSLNDGAGARLAQNSLSFYGASSLVNTIMMCGVMAVFHRRAFPALTRESRRALFFGGPLSFTAYALITWAFTQAPIAVVSALRETSIIFALVIGTVFFRERINLVKIVSTFVTLSGVIMLRLQR